MGSSFQTNSISKLFFSISCATVNIARFNLIYVPITLVMTMTEMLLLHSLLHFVFFLFLLQHSCVLCAQSVYPQHNITGPVMKDQFYTILYRSNLR